MASLLKAIASGIAEVLLPMILGFFQNPKLREDTMVEGGRSPELKGRLADRIAEAR